MENIQTADQLQQCILIATDPMSPNKDVASSMLNHMCNSSPDGGSVLCVHLMNQIFQQQQVLDARKQHQMDTIVFYTFTTLQRALKRKRRGQIQGHGSGSGGNGNLMEDLCIVPYNCRVELRQIIYKYIFGIDGTVSSSMNVNESATNNSRMPPSYLRTKIGVVMALLIQVDFPNRWQTAFQELMQVANLPSATASKELLETDVVRKDIFLRILDGFCDEIVEDTSVDRNTLIKDCIRGLATNFAQSIPVANTISCDIIQCLVAIFQTTIRHVYETPTITVCKELQKLPILTLSVLKRFISWVDLSLVINDSVISSLVACLRHAGPGDDSEHGSLASQCAAASIDCMKEIVSRGMDDEKKVQVIMDLNLLHIIHESGVNLTTVDGTHINVVIRVAELITQIGIELVAYWESSVLSMNSTKLNHNLNGGLDQLSSQLQLLIDIFFRCFAYDDIDVSGAVVPLATRLMTTLQKEMKVSGEKQNALTFRVSQQMPRLLSVMYEQMKYPPDFEFDYEDEDDAEEEMFRTELRKLNQSVTRITPDLSLQFLGNALSQIQTPLSSAPTHEIEAALRLVYHYCEGVRPPPGTKQALKNQMFRDVLTALHSSDVNAHPHREVLILYYDIAVRYAEVLKENQALLPSLLGSISGPMGLQHDHPRVRSRSCYLMLKLVKALVNLLRPYVETALSGIQGLLSNQGLSLHPDDTLYLFETMGLLLGRTGLSDEDQQRYLVAVMTPHMQRIEDQLKSPDIQRDPEPHGDALAYSVASLAYLTKGFTKKISPSIQAILSETVPGTLNVLKALPSVEVVRNKVMIYLQRLLICLGEQMLDVIPPFIQLLIMNCTQEDLLDVAQVLYQVCFKFKAKAIPIIDTCLLPFLNKCHEVTPPDCNNDSDEIPPHILTEQMNVKKVMFATLNQIVSSGCTPALISPKNLPSLENILRIVGDGAMNISDPIMKKNAIQFFNELSSQWIVNTNRTSDTGDANIVMGFQKYLLEVFIPGMFSCFLDDSFNERDAMQYRAVREVAATLSSLCSNRPELQLEQYIAIALTRHNYPTNFLSSIREAKTPSEMETYMKSLLQNLKQKR